MTNLLLGYYIDEGVENDAAQKRYFLTPPTSIQMTLMYFWWTFTGGIKNTTPWNVRSDQDYAKNVSGLEPIHYFSH